jgi:hypothetical protein
MSKPLLSFTSSIAITTSTRPIRIEAVPSKYGLLNRCPSSTPRKAIVNPNSAPGQGGSRVEQPFHYKYSEQGKEFSGRKLKTMTALQKDVDPADLKNSKMHFKGNKRANKFNVKYSNKSQNDYE